MAAAEAVDVVDQDDRVIRQATRAEVRAQNLRHRATYILLFNGKGQLFVHQRTVSKDVYPGCFDVAIGGVLAAGEGYDQAARRELAEELGVTAVPLRRVLQFQYEDAGNQVNGTVYTGTYDGPLRLQADEIVSGEWLDLDVVIERTQHAAFCPDGVEALYRYLDWLETVRSR
jgi:isopentenyldiphosphate isomerase